MIYFINYFYVFLFLTFISNNFIFAQDYKPVEYVDLTKYDGRWYQVYEDVIDKTFQGFSTCSVADYVILDYNNVSVLNSQINKNGNVDQISGYAFYSDGNTGGELTVELEGSGMAPYWIIELGPVINDEYQYAIVSDNLKLSLFVLARNIIEYFDDYDDEVLDSLEMYGFTKKINKPIIMDQTDCDYELYE
jgi:apolipoprotein D and lipocalin family protein